MKTRQQIRVQLRRIQFERNICEDEDEFNKLVALEKELRAELYK